mgnify:CR=1 FL=1
MNSFYTHEELSKIGFKSIGSNVLISRYSSIYSPEKISIGNNVRIDDFCILSGNLTLGSHIHISAYVAMYGSKGIIMEDYTGISPRSLLFSAMDDFSGDFLIGPVHSEELTNVTGGKIIISKFSQIGANSIIFPNVIINTGTIVGAFTLVNKSLEEWGIYVGIPAKRIKERRRNLQKLI